MFGSVPIEVYVNANLVRSQQPLTDVDPTLTATFFDHIPPPRRARDYARHFANLERIHPTRVTIMARLHENEEARRVTDLNEIIPRTGSVGTQSNPLSMLVSVKSLTQMENQYLEEIGGTYSLSARTTELRRSCLTNLWIITKWLLWRGFRITIMILAAFPQGFCYTRDSGYALYPIFASTVLVLLVRRIQKKYIFLH